MEKGTRKGNTYQISGSGVSRRDPIYRVQRGGDGRGDPHQCGLQAQGTLPTIDEGRITYYTPPSWLSARRIYTGVTCLR
jgi:hypothetical protein